MRMAHIVFLRIIIGKIIASTLGLFYKFLYLPAVYGFGKKLG